MQIHELTQPKKTKLDEVDWVGPDSVFAQAKSAWKTGGKSLVNQKADQEAQQARYQDYAANAIAKGKEDELDQKPTLTSAIDKLYANPVAKQWIAGIVAKWPDVANTLSATPTTPPTPPAPTASLGGKPLDPKNPNDAQLLAALAKQGIKEAPEYTTPGGIVVPSNSKTAQSPAPTQASATGPAPEKIKDWINSQLRTTTIEKIEAAENTPGLEEALKGVTDRIKNGIDAMAKQSGNIKAQQDSLEGILAAVTAANHVVEWERRTSGGNNLRYQGRQSQQTQPVQTGLTPVQLRNLGALADQAGGPDPKDTGNKFWNDLIKQAMGSR
jgi:hypothetical protein